MSTHKNNQYNSKLQPKAKALRSRMTKAEACLWKYVLKGRALKGYQFRRQRPIDQYIVDFKVIRFEDEEVLTQINRVREVILDVIEQEEL